MKKILFRAFFILISLGITLIFLEFFLRLNPKFGYIYNSFKLLKESEARMLGDLNNGCLRPSALLGYETIPNCDKSINSYGLIGPEYKLKKDKGIFRILVLGDSIAMQGLPCVFLEDSLNSNPLLHSKYKRFEIWNAGTASYDVRRYYLYLKHKGLNYKPDMVIAFLFMNDFNLDTNFYYKTKDRTIAYYFPLRQLYSRGFVISPFLIKHSYLYRFIVLRLNAYLSNNKKIRAIGQAKEDGRYYLGRIKEICQKNKIPLLVIVFPYLKPLYRYNLYQISDYQAVCRITKDLKINYLNLYEHLPEEDLYSLRDEKKDEIHPSQEGHRLIAKIIYDYLLDNFFIN